MRQLRLTTLAVIVSALLLAASAFAQNTTATIFGTVTDSSGAVVANARVTASRPSSAIWGAASSRAARVLTVCTGRRTRAKSAASVWQVIRHPYCYGLLVARLLTDPLPYFFTFWLPEYLKSSRGFTLAMIGLLGWIPFLAADVGGPGGGAWSDYLVRRGWNPQRARLRVMLVAACVMPLAAVAVRTSSTWVSLALIALLLGAHSCWIANLLTTASEVFARHQVGTVVGLAGMGGSIGGIISTLLTGRIIASYGYVPVFSALAFFHLAAFLFLTGALKRHAARRAAFDTHLKEALSNS